MNELTSPAVNVKLPVNRIVLKGPRTLFRWIQYDVIAIPRVLRAFIEIEYYFDPLQKYSAHESPLYPASALGYIYIRICSYGARRGNGIVRKNIYLYTVGDQPSFAYISTWAPLNVTADITARESGRYIRREPLRHGFIITFYIKYIHICYIYIYIHLYPVWDHTYIYKLYIRLLYILIPTVFFRSLFIVCIYYSFLRRRRICILICTLHIIYITYNRYLLYNLYIYICTGVVKKKKHIVIMCY